MPDEVSELDLLGDARRGSGVLHGLSEEIRRRCAEGSTSRENEGYKNGQYHKGIHGVFYLKKPR